MIAQVQGILKSQVVQLANTVTKAATSLPEAATGTQPFVMDATQPSGVRYDGNSGVNTVDVLIGRRGHVNVPGSQIFQGASGDVMGSLQGLITALQSGNTTAIGTATTTLRTSLDYVSRRRILYRNAINQLNSNQSYLQQEDVNLKSAKTIWWVRIPLSRLRTCRRRPSLTTPRWLH